MRFREDVDIANQPVSEADVRTADEPFDDGSDSHGRLDTDRPQVPGTENTSVRGRSSDGRVIVSKPVDLGVRHYLSLLLRYKLLIVAVVAGTTAVTVTRLLLRPETFMAKSTLLPSGGQAKTGVLGLLASFTGGPPLAGMSEEISSFLFPSILESREVGLEVLQTKYRFKKDGETIERTLEDHLQAESVDKALKSLYAIASFDVHRETGIITISASTLYPELSAQIVNRFVASLERVNLEMRRSGATQNSVFIHERLAQSVRELQVAEQNLTEFRKQNVRINSAELELEQGRLAREVSLKSQLFITLSNQAEMARIDEAKDIPVVRVLDRATVPKIPVQLPKLSSLLLGAIAGGLLAIMAVAGVEMFHYLRREVATCQRLLSGLAHR